MLLHGGVLSPRTLAYRIRSNREASLRRALADRLLRAGLIDAGYLGAQLGADFRSDEDAAAAWAATEPRLQYAPHPLIEPAWLDDARLSAAAGARRGSAGPQLALPGQRNWLDEASAVIARLGPTEMLSAAPGVAPVTFEQARRVAHERALEFARQNARSLRRHAVDFSPSATRGAPVEARTGPAALPLVSIVMPVRDRARVVGLAIDSIVAQRYSNWELIVVDDGSTDDTPAVVRHRATQDSRIRLIAQEARGVSAARNRGIDAAAGELVAFLDSDNTWTPEHLAAAVAQIGDNSRCAVHTVVRIRRSDGTFEFAAEQVDLATLLEGRNAVDLNALVVWRSALADIGGFDESLKRWVDYDLVLRLAKRLELRLVPVIGVDYDHRLDSLDRITTRESPLWRRVVLERALVDWEQLAHRLPERVDGVSVVIRTRARWAATLASVRHARTLSTVVDVSVVDAASPRAETGILALATSADDNVSVRRTAWDGGVALSTELALATSRARVLVALEPGATPTLEELSVAIREAAAAGGVIRKPHAPDGIVLVADAAALVASRGLDLVDDPLAAAE